MIRDDSKQILLSVFGIALLLIAVIGISYAVFIFTSKSMTNNTIRTGKLSFQYLEGNRVIQITDALPISDIVGKKQTEFFDFHISSTIRGDAHISYEIRAKSIPVEHPLDPKFVKLYLEKEQAGSYQTVLQPSVFQVNQSTSLSNSDIDLDTMLLYSDKISSKEKDLSVLDEGFRLRMWLDSSYPLDRISKSFKIKLLVYASM